MSREIKFRVWYPNYKKMHTGDEIDFGNACMDIRNGKLIFNIDELNYDEVPEYFAESGYVLMQFTGLLDKNGKEIYEGDCLKIWGNEEDVKKVIFKQGCFWIDEWHNYGENRLFCWTLGDTSEPQEHIEIIGNIYENTELMDGAK